ncbi:integrase, catalytic region, zinc finger, CCHC-type containing protein [Tanacetum coccineum]
MITLAKFMIIAGADNRPPMLEKSLYHSWKSRMELYIENRENGRMILNSVQNGPLVWPTVLQTSFFKVFHRHKVAKETWDRVKLLMQGTKLSLQEKECKLYYEFDKFSFVKGETLYQNQTTIQDDRVTVQQVQWRQGQSYAGTSYKGNATSSGGNNAGGLTRMVKCYNCQCEGHMARQCTRAKRPRKAAWFKEKEMLAKITIPNIVAFQTENLDAYDSECDDVSNAKAVRMANLSNYGLDVISEVPHFKPYHTDMDNQSVHAMQDFEQTPCWD